MTATATTYRANAAGRADFLADLAGEIHAAALAAGDGTNAGADWSAVDWFAMAARYAEAATLGRSEAWKAAAAFAQTEVEANPGDAAHAKWAVIQGQVWLGYAA